MLRRGLLEKGVKLEKRKETGKIIHLQHSMRKFLSPFCHKNRLLINYASNSFHLLDISTFTCAKVHNRLRFRFWFISRRIVYVETKFRRSGTWQFSAVKIFGSLAIRVFVSSGHTVILDRTERSVSKYTNRRNLIFVFPITSAFANQIVETLDFRTRG